MNKIKTFIKKEKEDWYRCFTDEEIEEWLEEDKINDELVDQLSADDIEENQRSSKENSNKL